MRRGETSDGADLAGFLVASSLVVVIVVATLAAFIRLGFAPGIAGGLVAAIGGGGRFNIPLSWRSARIGLNVGGALIPMAVALDQAVRLSTRAGAALVVSTGLVAAASYALARPVAGVGLVLPWWLLGLLGAALAMALAPTAAAGVAYVAGTVGPFIGADLTHLARFSSARAAIGGGGILDGLVWSGVLAACLAVAP